MQNKNIKTLLIDGYLDEPSCLGVPPYISPHIRYTCGALLAAGIKQSKLKYITIDQIREKENENLEWMEGFDLIIIIAGTTVPGHYLGGKPISLAEIKEIGSEVYYPQKILGGPLTLVKKNIKGFDYICNEIAALNIYELLTDKKIASNTEMVDFIGKCSLLGAELTTEHPSYPHLVCEIETFRGCPRMKHCAFCSERLKKIKYQRTPEQIISEVKELAKAGNHFFRLGCQTDLLLYQAQPQNNSFIPSPETIKKLYSGIRTVDENLKVLHLDNMNPATITSHETESKKILNIITDYNTTGDVAAFGLESADPLVLQKNNIATDPAHTLKAIKIINEIGGKRENGIPKLLPGLNLLHGLIGERGETMDYNYNFLQQILDNNLLLRRINIRQVVRLGNYPEIKINHGKFKSYKDKINKNINKPMLQKVFPAGTVIDHVLTEKHSGKLTYGRQLGSYPILIGIPGNLELNKFISVRIIDHGYRSITALPWPLKIKHATIEQLTFFPGIGNNKAGEIFVNQPQNHRELRQILGAGFPYNRWKDWFLF